MASEREKNEYNGKTNSESIKFRCWWRLIGKLKSAEKNLMDAMTKIMEYAVEGDNNRVNKLEGEIFNNLGGLHDNMGEPAEIRRILH